MVKTKKKTKVICAGCGEEIKPNEPAYQLRSGYIDEDGDFVRTDLVGQIFHIGKCLDHNPIW